MASTTLNVAVPRARPVASRARGGMLPPGPRRAAARCAAGEEVPLGVQIETALMDAFAPRFVGDRARAPRNVPETRRRRDASRHPNPLARNHAFLLSFPRRDEGARARPRRAPRLTRPLVLSAARW